MKVGDTIVNIRFEAVFEGVKDFDQAVKIFADINERKKWQTDFSDLRCVSEDES